MAPKPPPVVVSSASAPSATTTIAHTETLAAAAPPEDPAVARRRKNRLEILDEEGRTLTDRTKLLALCEDENSDACLVAAGNAKDPERRSLLEKSCRLENDDGCYALGLDLRAHAIDALRKTKEVRELLDFNCGIGKRTALTPILVNEAAACPPALAIAK